MQTSAAHVILNPNSGGGRAVRLRDEIVGELRARGVDIVLKETESASHARMLALEAAQSSAAMVIAAGGDGTIHDVANGLLHSGAPVPLALIPIGTGNDFVKVVPGAETRAGAYDIIAKPVFRDFDVGYAEWPGGAEFFTNGMGIGIDVEVVRQITRMPALPGPLKYLLGLFRALAIYQAATVRASLPGETLERRVMMFAIGNGVCQGGGFYLTPHARPDDGLLEMCVVQEIPLWQVAFVLPRVMRGTHAAHRAVTMRTFQEVRFDSIDGRPLVFQLDGELREPPGASWLKVGVRPRVLRVATKG